MEFELTDANILESIEKDYFDRNKYISVLIQYITDSDAQNTFAINGAWGTGKTVFMNQFKYVLDNEAYDMVNLENTEVKKIKTFYYNAWEHELLDSPTLALVLDLINEDKRIKKETKDKLKEVSAKLINVVVKGFSRGIIDFSDDIEEFFNRGYELDAIKESLKKTLDCICENEKCERIVIIIDELDRCKPTTVVKILEEFQHFYDYSKLTVLFSVDLKALSCTIKNLYGEQFNSDVYMQRFFDSVFSINQTSYDKYLSNYLLVEFQDDRLIQSTKRAVDYCDLSVRETNKLVKHIKSIHNTILKVPRNSIQYFENFLSNIVFVPLGIALKYSNTNSYSDFMNGKYDKERLIEYISGNSIFMDEIIGVCEKIDKLERNNANKKDYSIDKNVYDKIYELYKKRFAGFGFRSLAENPNDVNIGTTIKEYIEF